MKNILFLIALIGFLTNCSGESDDDGSTIVPTDDFTLFSAAIVDEELLDGFKCEQKIEDTENSIPLAWINVPEGTGSLAVIMYHYPDPNDVSGPPNTCLILWDINPSITEIPYGAADDGPWFMGPNKEGTAISYSSPCSSGSGRHAYTIALYALSETPASLPQESSLDVTWEVMQTALQSVQTLGVARLEFDEVTD